MRRFVVIALLLFFLPPLIYLARLNSDLNAALDSGPALSDFTPYALLPTSVSLSVRRLFPNWELYELVARKLTKEFTEQRWHWWPIDYFVYTALLRSKIPPERAIEIYVNRAYFGDTQGKEVWGIGTAARVFCGRPVTEVSLPEVAWLLATIETPSRTAIATFERRQRRILATLSADGVSPGCVCDCPK